MNTRQIITVPAFLVLALQIPGVNVAYAVVPTKFSYKDGVSNTRHNLTQRPVNGIGPTMPWWMDGTRNDYGEVCVYCHTPHGANANVTAPLWNRTLKATTYTTYDQLGTSSLTQTVSQPGIASLVCLSCHDGQTAVDSVINMPGSGRYNAGQATAENTAFLDAWDGIGPTGTHQALRPDQGPSQGCIHCHNGTLEGVGVDNFTLAYIGTDLTNDHPVGITFPAVNGPGTDFNTPTGIKGTTRFFETNGNGKMESAEVRMYDTGGGPQVECASCHDPHGVPSAGPGSTFNPTFLRVSNTGSLICQTCHNK